MTDNGKAYSIVVKEAEEVKTLDEAKHSLKVINELVKECESVLAEYLRAQAILCTRIEGDLALQEQLEASEQLNDL